MRTRIEFREFTHPQTVLKGKTRFNLSLREHPYAGKDGDRKMSLLKLFEKFGIRQKLKEKSEECEKLLENEKPHEEVSQGEKTE